MQWMPPRQTVRSAVGLLAAVVVGLLLLDAGRPPVADAEEPPALLDRRPAPTGFPYVPPSTERVAPAPSVRPTLEVTPAAAVLTLEPPPRFIPTPSSPVPMVIASVGDLPPVMMTSAIGPMPSGPIGPAPGTSCGSPERTVDQLLHSLRALRDQRAALDRAEQELLISLRARLQEQRELLARFGVDAGSGNTSTVPANGVLFSPPPLPGVGSTAAEPRPSTGPPPLATSSN